MPPRTKKPSQRRGYHQWLKSLRQKFPLSGDRIVDFLYQRVSRFDYGLLTLKDGELSPRHHNVQEVYNRRQYYQKLSKSDIICHLVSQQPDDKLWFTAEPFKLTPYGNSLVYVVFDFDNKEKVMDYKSFSLCVQYELEPLGLSGLWFNPSAGGYGVHGHLFLETVQENPADICAQVLRLQRLLRVRLSSVNFDVVAGSPVVFGEDEVLKSGKLALLPALRNDSECFSYLETMRRTVGLEALLLALEGEEGRGENTRTDCGSKLPLHPSAKPESQEFTQEGLSSPDPRVRMEHCGFALARRLGRGISEQELLQEYESQGLNTGADVGGRRKRRAAEVANYISRTFDPSKLGPAFGKRKAMAFLQALNLKQEDLQYGKGRTLGLETFAEYLVYVTALITAQNPDPERQGTVAKVAVLKRLGVSGGEYSALKRLAEKLDLIRTVSNSYLVGGKVRGRAKKYALGEAHPLSRINEKAA